MYKPKCPVIKVLKPGEVIFVSYSRLPESRLVTLGEHFVFDPPRKGRPAYADEMKQIGNTQDLSRAARLEAKVPLLLTIDCPWMDATHGIDILGCAVILHLRLARNTPLLADMAMAFEENAPEKNILRWEAYQLRIAANEAGKLTEVVIGGPAYAAVYEDEVVVPGYRLTDKNGEERPPMPYAYVLNQDEIGPLEFAFKREGREKAMVREAGRSGSPVELGIQAVGAITSVTIDKVRVSVDTTGRVFGIVGKNDLPLHSVSLNVGPRRDLVTLVLKQMVSHPLLREMLKLPELPQSSTAPRTRPNQTGLAALDKAFQDIENGVGRPIAPTRVVPTVERRAAAPKPSTVVPQVAKRVEAPQESPGTSLVALGGRPMPGGAMLPSITARMPMWPGQPQLVVLPLVGEEPQMRNANKPLSQGRGLPVPLVVDDQSDIEDLASL